MYLNNYIFIQTTMKTIHISYKHATRELNSLELDALELQMDNVGMYMEFYGSTSVYKTNMLGPVYWDLRERLRSLARSPDWSKLTASVVYDCREYARCTRSYMHGKKYDGTPGRFGGIEPSPIDDHRMDEFVFDGMVLLKQITAVIDEVPVERSEEFGDSDEFDPEAVEYR
jgi:hypothetical protein